MVDIDILDLRNLMKFLVRFYPQRTNDVENWVFSIKRLMAKSRDFSIIV